MDLAALETSPIRCGAIGQDAYLVQSINKSQAKGHFRAYYDEIDSLALGQLQQAVDVIGCDIYATAIFGSHAGIPRSDNCLGNELAIDASMS